MDQKTKVALESSIRKWVRISQRKGIDRGSDNCDLCRLFLNKHPCYSCNTCPVKERTNQAYCHGSPYEWWVTHHRQGHSYKGGLFWRSSVVCTTCEVLALKEVQFLESLREDENGEHTI